MEVRSEQGILSNREIFHAGMQNNPVQTQPPLQRMRLAFTPDGTAMYRPITTSSPPSAYQGGAVGGGDNAAAADVGSGSSQAVPAHGININVGEPVKRKRGRPRKYAPDGSVALSVSPSASIRQGAEGRFPPSFAGATNPASAVSADGTKKPRGRPPGSGKKKQMASLGSAGIGFTPHIIAVKAGEDVSSKIMSFSQHGTHTVCILSANGAISNVTLRQAATSGGTVTYEGRFEILSLSGSFLLSESGGQRSRTGGLSVSLAGPDGCVLGGGVAGLLTAASPVQVIVGSFSADGKKELKQLNPSDPASAPGKLAPDGMTGTNNPLLQGGLSESSGGPGSPPNQGTSICNNSNHELFSNFPWT